METSEEILKKGFTEEDEESRSSLRRIAADKSARRKTIYDLDSFETSTQGTKDAKETKAKATVRSSESLVRHISTTTNRKFYLIFASLILGY
jgi:hypothetical protein